MKKNIVSIIMVAVLIVIAAWYVSACTPTKSLVAPNPTGVQSGLSRTRSGITDAQAQASDIAKQNAAAQSDLSRVDAKDKFLEGYRKWKDAHKP